MGCCFFCSYCKKIGKIGRLRAKSLLSLYESFSNLIIMKRLLYILVVIFAFCGCSWFEETKPQTPSDDSGAFKAIVGDLNGFDQFVYNENSFIVYKQSQSGLPEAMLVYVNEDGQEVVEVVYFDGRGIPQYYNINGESIYVENVRDNYCDLHLINSDGTITIIPDTFNEVSWLL